MDQEENTGYNALDSPEENEASLFDDLKGSFWKKDAVEEETIEKRKKNKPSGRKQFIIGSTLVLVLILTWTAVPLLREPKPPAPDIVASYNEKNISIEELNAFLLVEGAREGEHYICEKHGLAHSKCDAAEACELHPIDSLEGYRAAVQIMATEQIILDWAKEKGLTQKEEVQHNLSDLFDYANVEETLTQIAKQQLSAESIPKLDIQLYFEENKAKYDGKTLPEVENEIRQILLQKKGEEYFPAYIEELKKTAGLQVNYELLREIDFLAKEKQEDTSENDYNPTADYRMNETLFSIHGRNYTVGEFYQEFMELPENYKETFSDYEKRKTLVDQLIAKELLLEESTDMADTKEDGHDLEELKIEYLSQLLHKEEVDQKLEDVAEEEITAFYEKNKSSLKDQDGKQLSYEDAKDVIREHLKAEKHYALEKNVEKTILEKSNFTIYDKTIKKMIKNQKGKQ